MESGSITIKAFFEKPVRKGPVPSLERTMIAAMKPGQALWLIPETLVCRMSNGAKSCSILMVVQKLSAQHTDRYWIGKHEKGSRRHFIACMPIPEVSGDSR